jgi:uroporphyrin-III C-methyltransferase
LKNTAHTGKVIIAGAGCGDPELITVKAAKYLQQADVILVDRLVSAAIITQYANAKALVVNVGKQHNNDASIPQQTINDLLVQYAVNNKLVVRLKGGDVAFFSNVLDELETLVTHQIPFEIIPGVTAASGASAYAGIPLTARGYSTAVRFLTYYKDDIVSDGDWKMLAETDDTLIFYMSSNVLDTVVAQLVKNKIAADKLLAIVEQATTPQQRVTVHSLYNYAEEGVNTSYASPALVIIGRVVALHQQFSWFKNGAAANELYFKTIT